MSEPVVVSAVAVAAAGRDRALGWAVQSAMAQAVMTCAEYGITTEEKNSKFIRACMEAAREEVKAAWPKNGAVNGQYEVLALINTRRKQEDASHS